MKRILLGLLLGILVSCGTESGTSASSPEILVPTPDQWQRQDNYPIAAGVSADFIILSPTPYESFRANVIVISQEIGAVSLEEAVQFEIQAMQSDSRVSSFQVDSSYAKSIDDCSGYVLEANFIQQGFPIQSRELFIVKGKTGYQIIFTRHLFDLSSQLIFSQIEAGISLP